VVSSGEGFFFYFFVLDLADYAYYFVGLLPTQGKDIVFRFIIEYSSSLRDFGP